MYKLFSIHSISVSMYICNTHVHNIHYCTATYIFSWINNFKDFADVHRTSEIYILEIVRSIILKKEIFDNPRNYISSKISYPMVFYLHTARIKDRTYLIQYTRLCCCTSHSLTLLSNDPEYNMAGSSLFDDKHQTHP